MESYALSLAPHFGQAARLKSSCPRLSSGTCSQFGQRLYFVSKYRCRPHEAKAPMSRNVNRAPLKEGEKISILNSAIKAITHKIVETRNGLPHLVASLSRL